MTRIALISLALVFAACGSGEGDANPDAGSTPDAGDTSPDAGDTTPDAGDEPPPPEPCDLEDYATEDCTGVSEGSCSPGVRICFEGFWTACEGRVQPVPKMCDFPSCAGGPNEGCECVVGETRDCFDGDSGLLGAGTCRGGRQFCVPTVNGSSWGPCQGQVLPQAEDCSGRDLDCVRDLPETGCECTNGQTRACGGVTGGSCQLGTQTCSGGTWGECTGYVQPEPGACDVESCAGGPNPGCECVIGATEPCYTGIFGSEGVGSCAAGTRTCGENAKWGLCLNQQRPQPSCDVASCTGTPLEVCQ